MLKLAISGCNGRMGRVITEIAAKREDILFLEELPLFPLH